jgi:hypothetical protein
LKAEHGLNVFEGRVPKKLLGPEREKVRRDGRKLHSELLYDLLSLPSITWVIKPRIMRWVGHVTHSGEKINAYRFLVGKPRGRRKLGKPRRGW